MDAGTAPRPPTSVAGCSARVSGFSPLQSACGKGARSSGGEDEQPGEEREARGPLPEIAGITIVMLGALNPAILHPSWLARNGLLRPQEADQANIVVVAPEIAAFDIGWVAVQATHERLQLSSTSAPSYSMVKDLAVGIFSLLEHTPISAVGINHNQHFRAESDERWHRFGHLVAPVEPWRASSTMLVSGVSSWRGHALIPSLAMYGYRSSRQ